MMSLAKRTQAGFTSDGNPGILQGADVPVDRAQTDTIALCDFFAGEVAQIIGGPGLDTGCPDFYV